MSRIRIFPTRMAQIRKHSVITGAKQARYIRCQCNICTVFRRQMREERTES